VKTLENEDDRYWSRTMQLDRTTEGILLAVKEVGCRFSMNTQSGVTAVCTNKAVYDTVTEYTHKVSDGVVGASERVILLVRPTFTIASSEFTQRPIHTTGAPNGWYNAIQAVLAKIYGLYDRGPTRGSVLNFDPASPYDRKKLDQIADILFQRDPRIYVPFADNYSPLWQLYSATSIKNFQDALTAEVPTLY
jgi:hypothetical protein